MKINYKVHWHPPSNFERVIQDLNLENLADSHSCDG
jgi:hypothetical protein